MVHYNNEGKITTDAVPTTPPTGGPAERYMPGKHYTHPGGYPPGDPIDNARPLMEVGRAEVVQNNISVPNVINEHQLHLLIINDQIQPLAINAPLDIRNTFSTTQVIRISDLIRGAVDYKQLRGRSWSSVIVIGVPIQFLRHHYPDFLSTVENGTYSKGTTIAEIY